MTLNDFQAVIFDLDGLILDREPTYFAAWQRAATQMGFALPDTFFSSLSGHSYKEIQALLKAQCGQQFDFEVFHRLSSQCWRDLVLRQGIVVKRGVLNLVERLNAKNIPYCIATNSPRANALECLTLANIAALFPCIVAREDVIHAKPMPDIFLKAASVLNVDVTACVVFEDSLAGVLAASRAGAFTVFVPSVLPADSEASALAHLTLAHLDEFLIFG
ncbi:MAG TPA: HAD family phosphatase [Methylococcaceae bacterium]|nr:HAD family phosphatase [Methylococcaceae bacterium]